MARRIRPMIGTDNTFSVSSGASDINGATIQNDFPPSSLNVAAIFIHSDGNSVVSITVTVKCQFYSGVDWGPLNNVVDENGNNVTFDPSVDEDVEANMYAQPWWKENDGWRIVLSRSAPSTVAGQATVIER